MYSLWQAATPIAQARYVFPVPVGAKMCRLVGGFPPVGGSDAFQLAHVDASILRSDDLCKGGIRVAKACTVYGFANVALAALFEGFIDCGEEHVLGEGIGVGVLGCQLEEDVTEGGYPKASHSFSLVFINSKSVVDVEGCHGFYFSL